MESTAEEKFQNSPSFSRSKLLNLPEEFEEKKTEEKLQHLLNLMRDALCQEQGLNLKEFWEVRKFCLPLFKESLSSKLRLKFWTEYTELTKEARRLKEILESEASFTCEQIEIAIHALQGEIEKSQELLNSIPDIEVPENCTYLIEKRHTFNKLQKELQLLNNFATRINSLRDEILKTQTKIRFKNRLFEQLMKIGDFVFPRRKELIQNLSFEFSSCIDDFIKNDFSLPKALPYVLKEKIKSLQSFGGELTLNVTIFAETRKKLSECWDSLKNKEKEYKKQLLEKKEIFRQNYEIALKKIEEFAAKCSSGHVDEKQFESENKAILDWMKTILLGKDEVKDLKLKLKEASKPIVDQIQEKEFKRKNQEKEVEKAHKEKRILLQKQMSDLLEENEKQDVQQLSEKYEQIFDEVKKLSLDEKEKISYMSLLRDVKEIILDKKQKILLASEEDVLEKIYELLDERKQMRQELKHELENYRKAIGGSGLDFEKSMILNELMISGKKLLEKIDSAIIEIEERIFDLVK